MHSSRRRTACLLTASGGLHLGCLHPEGGLHPVGVGSVSRGWGRSVSRGSGVCIQGGGSVFRQVLKHYLAPNFWRAVNLVILCINFVLYSLKILNDCFPVRFPFYNMECFSISWRPLSPCMKGVGYIQGDRRESHSPGDPRGKLRAMLDLLPGGTRLLSPGRIDPRPR